ncbi:MAG: hypothetical protein ABSG03_14085 [Bryobacteraceae bacterium]|jgi:hypothetical protein
MTITENDFWNEVERLDAIKRPDCLDSWLLMELDEELSNTAASELTDAERWHIGMGCARCNRIMMLARITRLGDVAIGEPEQEKPRTGVIEFKPRTWRVAGKTLPLAASTKLSEMFPILFDLPGGNIKLRIGSSEEPGKYQVDMLSNADCTCVLRIYDGATTEAGGGEIVWPPVRLYANRKTILPLSGENLELLMKLERIDVEISEALGDDVAEGDTLA